MEEEQVDQLVVVHYRVPIDTACHLWCVQLSISRSGRIMHLSSPYPVCMFIEESHLGRCYWRHHLCLLLQLVAATFNSVLQNPTARNGEWGYITVKVRAMLLLPLKGYSLLWH